MGYRRDLWEIAASRNAVVTVAEAEDAGVPAVELRKLASRGALRGYGQGVYVHRDVPITVFTEPTIAVALAGKASFLQRESVLQLLGLGQFNPPRVRVGTFHRVRRVLPLWMELERRSDIDEREIVVADGIRMTTVARAIEDLRTRIPRDRWDALIVDATQRGIDLGEATLLNERSSVNALPGKGPAI